MLRSVSIQLMWSELPYAERAAAAAGAGFDLVDLWDSRTSDIDGVAKACRDNGIGIDGFFGNRDVSLCDPEQRQAALDEIARSLDVAVRVVPIERTATLVGLAGTVTSVTAHVLGLDHYDRSRIDAAELPVDAVLAACDDLLHASHARRAALGFMHPGRVDVIGAGALVWHDVVSRVRDAVATTGRRLDTVLTSEHDILDGIAWSVAERLAAR